MKFKIRKAKKSDGKSFIKLVNELAYFEKLEPPDKKGKKRLIKDCFSKKPLYSLLIAEAEGSTESKTSKKKKEIAGYAVYFFTYSTFLARPTLYLEDVFVSESYRSKGLGKLFFDKLLKIARKKKCGKMEWVVLDWNVKAIKFYEELGAEYLKDWKTYRLMLKD